MRPELQARFLRVSHNLERLEQVRNLVDDRDEVSPRSLVASAAFASAEFLAAAMGSSEDVSVVHRAYEEIFAALENSGAINELLAQAKTASASRENASLVALRELRAFRLRLAGGDDE